VSQLRLMAVAEYAKLRGISPQLVHYYIRTNKLEVDLCECGRRCVRVEEADAFLREKGKLEDVPD
jgi:predicted site-specific integrase-resolvase